MTKIKSRQWEITIFKIRYSAVYSNLMMVVALVLAIPILYLSDRTTRIFVGAAILAYFFFQFNKDFKKWGHGVYKMEISGETRGIQVQRIFSKSAIVFDVKNCYFSDSDQSIIITLNSGKNYCFFLPEWRNIDIPHNSSSDSWLHELSFADSLIRVIGPEKCVNFDQIAGGLEKVQQRLSRSYDSAKKIATPFIGNVFRESEDGRIEE